MNRLDRYLMWLLACAAASAAVAWIAFGLQQEGFAPAVLFPLLVGAAVGVACTAARRATGAPGRRAALAAAVVWALLVVVGQDYIGHRRRLRTLETEMTAQGPVGLHALAQIEEFAPSFGEHLLGVMRREPVWWSVDLALTAAAAAAATAWGMRRFPPASDPQPRET